MAQRGRVQVSITGDNAGLHRSLKGSEKDITHFERTTTGALAGVHKAAGLALGLTGLGGLAFGLKDVAQEAVRAQTEEAKLAQAVKNAGISWKGHREQVEKTLSATSEWSGFSKSELSAALANMVRTTGTLKGGFSDLTIAMDLARTKGIDLAGAQSLVARAALGNTRGLKSLGIAVNPVTTAQDKLKAATAQLNAEIKNSHGSRKTELEGLKGKHDALLAEAKASDQSATRTRALALLNDKFHGQAVAASKTAQGQFLSAKQSLTIAQEELGRALLPVIAKAATAVANLAQAFVADFPKISAAVRSVTGPIGQAISGASAAIKTWVSDNRKTLNDLATIFEKVGAAIKAVIDGFIIPTIQRMIPAVKQIFGGLTRVIKGAVEVIAGILTLDFGKAWAGVKDIFSGGMKTVGGVIRGATAPLRQEIAMLGGAIGDGFSSIWSGVLKTADRFINDIIDVINVLPGIHIKHVGAKSSGPSFGGGGNFPAPKKGPATYGSGVGHHATGGVVTKPMAIVGEEAPQHPEFVIATNPAYRQRNIKLLGQAARSMGIPGFGLGGILKGLPLVGSIAGLHLPSNPFAGSPLSGMGSYILSHAASAVTGLFGSGPSAGSKGGGGPVGGGTAAGSAQVRSWAAQALRITGHYTPANLNALVARIMFESGGNPRAINLTDINARQGHPSKGLGQTIDSTFQAYRDPRLPDDVYDPVANLVASVNYMYARYGHVVGNTGVGYYMGGVIGGDGGSIDQFAMAASSNPYGPLPGANGPAPKKGRKPHAPPKPTRAINPITNRIETHTSAEWLRIRLQARRNAKSRKVRGLNPDNNQIEMHTPAEWQSIRLHHSQRAAAERARKRGKKAPAPTFGIGGMRWGTRAAPNAPPGDNVDAVETVLDDIDLHVQAGDIDATAGLAEKQGVIAAALRGGWGDLSSESILKLRAQSAGFTSGAADDGGAAQRAQDAIDAQKANTEALNAVKDEIKRQNDFATSVANVTSAQAVRALSDVISGQITGVGYAGRQMTAGAGSVYRA